MRPLAGAAAVAGLGAVLLSGFPSRGDEPDGEAGGPPLVLLLSLEHCCPDEAWPEAERAVADELATLSLRVEIADAEATGDGARLAELETAARERGAACSLRIQRAPASGGGGVDLWIADRVTGKTTVRRVEVGERSGTAAAAIAALRTVEALRASLLELRIERTTTGEVDPTPELRELADAVQVEATPPPLKSPPRMGLGLGVGPLGSPGGLGVIGAVGIAVGWHPMAHLTAEIDGLLGVLGRDIEAAGASSSFDLAAVRAWAHWDIRGGGRLRPLLGVGAGALFSWTEGHDTEGYAGRSDRTVVAFLGGAGQLGLAITTAIWLRLGVRVGALVPEVKVIFAEQQVVSFGLPVIEGFALAEVRFL